MPKETDNKNANTMSTEAILDQLAFIANEDVKLRDNAFLKQNRKRKISAGTKENAKFEEDINKSKKPAENENNGQKEAPEEQAQTGKKGPAKKPETKDRKTEKESKKAAASEDPFTALAAKMAEDRKVLEKSEEKEPPHEASDKGERPSGKLSGRAGKLGEEITREEAENVITGKGTKKRGHRATIIIHRTVVDTEGNEAEDPYEGKTPEEIYASKEELPEEKARAREPKTTPDKPENKTLILVRNDTGEAYTLDRDILIGREDDNDLVIPEPEGHYVSGHHAEIRIKDRDIYLKDTGSTNGTFVNNSRIASKRLKSGQKIKFADVEFTVAEG